MKIETSKTPVIHNKATLLRYIKDTQLNKILTNKNNFYKLICVPKQDGKPRETYSIGYPLKKVHTLIKTNILDKAKYPDYLHGSLKNKSPKTNAEFHVKSSTVITLDIKSFFPSITEQHIFNIFRGGFKFSKSFSHILTSLLTHNGCLPQGSPASSHIANLVFFDKEDFLVKKFIDSGYRYTRYVDDITISSQHPFSNTDKTGIIGAVSGMIKSKGFCLNNKKTKIQGKSSSQRITRLVTNRKVNIPKDYVNKVYVQIKRLKKIPTDNIEKEIRSIKGKINYVKKHNVSKAEYLKRHLENIQQLHSQSPSM